MTRQIIIITDVIENLIIIIIIIMAVAAALLEIGREIGIGIESETISKGTVIVRGTVKSITGNHCRGLPNGLKLAPKCWKRD